MRQTRQMRRKRRRKRNNLKKAALIMLILVIAGLVILLGWQKFFAASPVSTAPVSQPLQAKQPKETDLSILCVGDVMSHNPQTSAQYDSATKTYNYDNNFTSVKKYIQEADLAMCNVETTFAGEPYTGFPTFSSPNALASALGNAGFDVGITANNHMADKGTEGLTKTITVLQEKGLNVVGTVQEKEDPRYLIQEVKGVKVGIVAYTYETGSGEGSTSINGSSVSDETADRLNSFNANTLDQDLPKIQKDIDGARDAGAQIIIAYYHWGEEYQNKSNETQKELAQKTADMGVDIIFASHPHVLQETAYLTPKDSNKKVPIFYSMGNFISNQRSETLNNRYTEQGLMAQINLTYSEESGIKDITMDGIPTWVDKYVSEGKTMYEIIPLDDDLKNNEALSTSGHLSRAEQALEDVNGILGLNDQ